MKLFHTNGPLLETIAHDPGLKDETKELFVLLSNVPNCTSGQTINQFCELMRRNYVWIEGFPPPPLKDRTKRAIRIRGLKALITGKE
jgi:hypothetical protein